ncbi:MAG TPA: 30S ribosomal protein S1 [bacterium]|nr:30S ribosomal protein S1 [bacterium]
MVDVEKPEQQEEMIGPENPIEKTEGGDTEQDTPREEAQPSLKQTAPSSPAGIDEADREYSEEEYQRFVEFYDRTLSEIRQGEIVVGRVLAVSDNDVLVDIGFKSEGVISIEEFGDPPSVKVGDEIEVYLEDLENPDGQLILSKRKATFMRLWDKVVDIYNQGGTIEGTCVRRIKGGMVVDLMGVDAFLPGSQIDVKPVRDFDSLIGKTFTFKVVKVNRLRKNIVVSRRALLEESMAEEKKEVLATLEKNQIREGTVKNITDFGVFVDLGGVDGLLHINDLSWGRINHPSEVVKLDEKIKVMVLDFNDAKDRISLGFKQLQPHPWEKIDEKYPEGAVVTGKVVSIADYGAFVELEKGVEGLIHVSEMSWTRHGIHPSKVVSVGETLEVKILSLDQERKRISLGLKQLTEDPWENIEEKYPVGSHFKGRVRNMTNFGAFIEMEEGIDGLIHISDLSWTKKIRHPSEVLKKGEEVEVEILDVNKSERRISLGYKQLTEDPWPEFAETYKVGTVTEGRVARFVDKGMVVELPLGLEGFIPLSHLEEETVAKAGKKYQEGDSITAVVIEFDRNNKRVVLSSKRVKDIDQEQKTGEEKADVKAYMNAEKATTLGDIADLKSEEPEKDKDDKAAKSKKEKTKPKSGPETGSKQAKEVKSEDKEDEQGEEEPKESGKEADTSSSGTEEHSDSEETKET